MKIGITERGDAAFHLPYLTKIAPDYDCCIWITKRPSAITDPLPSNVLVHCTITGWGNTILEPYVNSPETEIYAYNDLLDKYGPERIILRVDPVVLTDEGIKHAKTVIEYAAIHSEGRVRVSFLDSYNHVLSRFKTAKFHYNFGFHAPLAFRKQCLATLQTLTSYPIEVCGEPDIPCTGCVSIRDLKAIGLNLSSTTKSHQRPSCACLGEKTELLKERKPCPHHCLYCYWK